jgi:carbon storage regulator
MLKLSRKVGQTVVLETSDGPITLQVIEIRGQQVRIGFDAPRAVIINREEVQRVSNESAREGTAGYSDDSNNERRRPGETVA